MSKTHVFKRLITVTAKETFDKTKRQPTEWDKKKRQSTEWEKTFENDMTENGLISKIYKQLI